MAEVIAPEVAEKINLIHDLDEFEHDEVARAQALESKQQQDKPKEEFRNYTNSTRQERVEKFYKEQHENQTYEFVEEMKKKYAAYNNMNMGIWEALEYLDNLVDNSDPDTDLSQLQHALQTAESMRKKYPGEEYDWFHLTGLIHDLGKILSFKCNEPQWAVVGDTFPVGCAFSDRCVFPQYFDNNPDRHHKTYSTLHGVYQPHCGLSNIKMSWGHDEYLYRVCVENGSTLPTSALYMIRYHSFYPWHQQGAYTHLTNEQDDENLKWVKMFNQFDLYSKADDLKSVEELKPYYQKLIKKYFPDTLRW